MVSTVKLKPAPPQEKAETKKPSEDYGNLLNSDIWAKAANPKAKLKALNRNLGNTKSKLFA